MSRHFPGGGCGGASCGDVDIGFLSGAESPNTDRTKIDASASHVGFVHRSLVPCAADLIGAGFDR